MSRITVYAIRKNGDVEEIGDIDGFPPDKVKQ